MGEHGIEAAIDDTVAVAVEDEPDPVRDPDLRAGTSEDKFGTLFIAISKKLGNPVSFNATGWNVDKVSDGTFLKATCRTKFSNNASGTETYEWRKTDGKYLLFSYHIKSDELKTR